MVALFVNSLLTVSATSIFFSFPHNLLKGSCLSLPHPLPPPTHTPLGSAGLGPVAIDSLTRADILCTLYELLEGSAV